jgi:hypothetical protein
MKVFDRKTPGVDLAIFATFQHNFRRISKNFSPAGVTSPFVAHFGRQSNRAELRFSSSVDGIDERSIRMREVR